MKFLGIRGIEESSVYRSIFNKGRVMGAQEILLLLGRARFGEPGEAIRAEIQSLRDHDELNLLIDRLSDVASWNELLSTLEAVGFAAGRLEEARWALLSLGREKFGEPSGLIQLEIDGTTEIDRFHSWLDRILDAQSWDELFPPSVDWTGL
jgi:hypothetical protein